jgi:hypothetical protein
VGTWIAQHSQAGRDEKRLNAEEQHRRLRDLKDAYADWFGAVQQLTLAVSGAELRGDETSYAGPTLENGLAKISALGCRVRLLESDPEARERTIRIETKVNKFIADVQNSDVPNLDGLEQWLREVRFAPGRAILL